MNSRQRIAVAVGGGIIALAAAVGVGAFTANLAGGGQPQTQQQGTSGRAGQGGQPGLDTTELAKSLATKLGTDEAKTKTALDNAMRASRPSGNRSGLPSGEPTPTPAPGGNPTDAPGPGDNTRRSGMLAAIAKSVAAELNLDEAKVLAALNEVWTSSNGAGGQRPGGRATR